MISELVSVDVGRARFSLADVPVALALVVLGPVPAILVALAGVVFDAAGRRPPRGVVLNNMGSVPAAVAVVSTLWIAVGDEGWVEPGSGGFAAGALVVTIMLDLTMFLANAFTSSRLVETQFMVMFRRSYVAMLPWTLIAGGLVAGTAHAVATLGDGPLFVLAAIIGTGQLTLLAIARLESREVDLQMAVDQRDRHAQEAREAAAQAREQVARAVHDDPLQVFVLAHQDLRELREGGVEQLDRPIAKLDEGLRQLRSLLLAQTGSTGQPLSMTALEAEVSRQGLKCEIRFDIPPSHPSAAMLAAAARELVRNAVAHAAATTITVTAWCTDDRAVLEVHDDGLGYDIGLASRRRADGHLGLQLLDRRVVASGGHLEIVGEGGHGTKVTITVPAARPASGA